MSDMASNIITDVDLAKDVRAFMLSNLDGISFANPDLKKAITNADDDDLLSVGKIINSPIKIVSVDKVDADFFRRHLFKNVVANPWKICFW